MNYKEFNITREERLQQADDIHGLKPYIMALKKKELGELKCEGCGKVEEFDIHHKTYKLDLTYYDLLLLCWNCHKPTIGFNRC